MPLTDVKVIINLKKPSALIGLGKPLILAKVSGSSPSYKEYLDLESLSSDLTTASDAYKLAQAIYAQGDTRPEKIAVATYDPAAPATSAPSVLESFFYNDWYFVLLDTGTVSDYVAISDYVELQNLKVAAHVVRTQNDLSVLKDKEYDRTFVFLHSGSLEYPNAALIGAVGSQEVGSVTWKFKTLKGITPTDLSATELSIIHAEGGLAYVTKAGINQTSEGKMISGEYIDVIHSKDWVQLNLEQAIQYLLSTTKKVPFTNVGIAQIEDTARTVFETAGKMGIISEESPGKYSYTLSTLKRDEVLPSDRVARKYNGLSFSFNIAGAIHEAEVQGEIIF